MGIEADGLEVDGRMRTKVKEKVEVDVEVWGSDGR